MNVKQVIVVRRDLHMRRGKEIAQGAHAAMMWLAEAYREKLVLSAAEQAWLDGAFTKVVVQVASEAELFAVHDNALEAGVCTRLVQDAGRTEFGGVPTYTCCAVGPDEAALVDTITSHLKLY